MTRPSYPIEARNRAKRMYTRASYDHRSVHEILDAAALCHIAYEIDGQPYCTPTMFWREGTTLYWHGSSKSKMIKAQKTGLACCLTVTHFDGLVLARSAMNHSANFRTVMAFGTTQLIDDPDEKYASLLAMVDRLYPDRTTGLREVTAQEIKATAFIAMEIETATAKVRSGTVGDDEEDYVLPIYAEVLPIRQVIGSPEPCPRLLPNVARAPDLRAFKTGACLDEVLSSTYKQTFGDA